MSGDSTHIIPSPDQLDAVYDPVKHQLTLSAKGNYVVPLVNPKFVQLPYAGGFLFEVSAFTHYSGPGPVGQKWDDPYEFSTVFNINLCPYNEYVTVRTGNHRHGIHVPIDYLGWGKGNTSSAPEEATKVLEKTVQSKPIHTLEAEPFTISAPASDSSFHYTVNVQYNTDILTLIDSEIKDTEIVWTFTSHNFTGLTQVVVTQFGSAKPPAYGTWQTRTTHDVIIVLPGPGKE